MIVMRNIPREVGIEVSKDIATADGLEGFLVDGCVSVCLCVCISEYVKSCMMRDTYPKFPFLHIHT